MNQLSPTTTHAKSECHTGNVPVFTYGKGQLYAGGWNRGMTLMPNSIMIDLTGQNSGKLTAAGSMLKVYNEVSKSLFLNVLKTYNPVLANTKWLSFEIKDMNVPDFGEDVFDALVEVLKQQMDEGVDVLLGCLGGHGRTGLVLSILVKKMRPDLLGDLDPVTWVRQNYCQETTETDAQIDYVFNMFDDLRVIPTKERPESAHKFYAPATTYNYGTGSTAVGPESWYKTAVVEDVCELCYLTIDPRHGDERICEHCLTSELALQQIPFGDGVEESRTSCVLCKTEFSSVGMESVCGACLGVEAIELAKEVVLTPCLLCKKPIKMVEGQIVCPTCLVLEGQRYKNSQGVNPRACLVCNKSSMMGKESLCLTCLSKQRNLTAAARTIKAKPKLKTEVSTFPTFKQPLTTSDYNKQFKQCLVCAKEFFATNPAMQVCDTCLPQESIKRDQEEGGPEGLTDKVCRRCLKTRSMGEEVVCSHCVDQEHELRLNGVQ